MLNFALVAIGGAVGAMTRYGVGLLSVSLGVAGFPWATLGINVVGGFAMGLLAGALSEGGAALRLLLGVGVLGGFTTFSAFSLDAVRLMEADDLGGAAAYVLLSVVLSIGGCWLGLVLARGLSA